MWEAKAADGRKLSFRLNGINNQNFIMRDEETGSWWQQVSGEAIHGPLKGERLRSVFHDELSFQLWRRERPGGRVLRPDEAVARAGRYAPADWEAGVARMPVTTSHAADPALEPRALVVGLRAGGSAKAYPLEALRKQSPVLDEVGGVPLFLVVGEDGKSVRAFERTVDGRRLEFFVKPGGAPLALVDAETGSEWDFAGRATAGPLAGSQLKRVPVLNDYWFDWKAYNPQTALYMLGDR